MTQESIEQLVKEILTLSPSSSHHHINSENPSDHWNFTYVKDQIVLDLGCGFHLIEDGWETTPEYFLNRGAIKIIGVDPEGNDINYFKNKFPQHDFHCDMIDSIEKIEGYINNNNITSMKMDIEGYETMFINSTSQYPTLKYVAIETHNRELLRLTIDKLTTLGFTIDKICTFYERVFDVCNLIYAHRN